MGTTIDAHCYGCGYDASVPMGGGRRTFRTLNAYPAICRCCAEVVTVNRRERPLRCQSCGDAEIELPDRPADQDEADEWDALRYGGQSAEPATKSPWAEEMLERRGARPDPSRQEAAPPHDRPPSKAAYTCPKCGRPQLRFGTEFDGPPLMWD